MTLLADHVSVERRFQRSIRLDADVDQIAPLQGYVLQQTARTALATTARLIQAGQGAFTWTGPYGGGKSSLALALAGLVSGELSVAEQARELLHDTPGLEYWCAAPPGEWLSVVVTGRRCDPVVALREALETAIARGPGKARTRRPRSHDPAGHDILDRIHREIDARPRGGVLVIIDELGKFLEAAADDVGDLHVFQDLAEASNRAGGRLVLIGVLHQSFERYANVLGASVQDDWAKIQGRFVDIPLVAAADEVIDLVGQAIHSDLAHCGSLPIAKDVAACIARRRSAVPEDLAARLDACWPLHPVTTALLGPISRRRFGQNERSVFGLLTSAEPKGFAEFLSETHVGSGETFDPAALWDYLRVNLEPAILASPDGHRWATAAEVVDRSRQFDSSAHERVAKTVCLIDLFANGSGIAAERSLVETCLNEAGCNIEQILRDLVGASILIYRRHLDSYAVHAGSDFNIDQAISERLAASEELDVEALNRLARLRPILAKAHHHRTGTPRWFDATMVPLLDDGVPKIALRAPEDAAGAFRLVVPVKRFAEAEALGIVKQTSSRAESAVPIAFGLPPRCDHLLALGREFVALGEVRDHHALLEGDVVARREVDARLSHISARLAEQLRLALEEATWFICGEEFDSKNQALSMVASRLADETFEQAPVIQSELINRQRPSSNTVAALRPLLQAMVGQYGQPHFGIEGYPAERGLASTVLEGTGLYASKPRNRDDGLWALDDPATSTGPAKEFRYVWEKADDLFTSDNPVSLNTLYASWQEPPLGLRRGVMPILAVAYVLSRRERVALYLEGVFQPILNDLLIDRLLQDPTALSARLIKADRKQKQALEAYAAFINEQSGEWVAAEPLPIAQGLVEFVFKLPSWSRHARGRLSPEAVKVRQALLHADDPHRLLDTDLPASVGQTSASAANAVCDALAELESAFDDMVLSLREKLVRSLKHRGDDYNPLRQRARAIEGEGGSDLKLRSFISRLTTFDGSINEVAEICGLVTGQPVSQWRDLEPGRASVQLADYAYRFRRIELFGDQRDPTQTAVMVMAGVGEAERSVVRRAQISLDAQRDLEPVVRAITTVLDEAALDQDLLLAVLAEVAQRRLEDDGEADVAAPLTVEGKP